MLGLAKFPRVLCHSGLVCVSILRNGVLSHDGLRTASYGNQFARSMASNSSYKIDL